MVYPILWSNLLTVCDLLDKKRDGKKRKTKKNEKPLLQKGMGGGWQEEKLKNKPSTQPKQKKNTYASTYPQTMASMISYSTMPISPMNTYALDFFLVLD